MAKKRLTRRASKSKPRKSVVRDVNDTEETNGDQLLASDAPLGYNPIYDAPPLTDFASVTTDTLLGTLNLNWREHDLPEHVRAEYVQSQRSWQ